MNQLRSSRTECDSDTNPNICQFVAISGIRGLCGIGVLEINGFVRLRNETWSFQSLFWTRLLNVQGPAHEISLLIAYVTMAIATIGIRAI